VRESCIILLQFRLRICPDLTKEECEAYGLIQRSFCRFLFLDSILSRPSLRTGRFFCRQFPCGKEVTCFGICKFTKWRISGFTTQTLPQKSCQKWSSKYCPPQTLVRFQERAAPHGKKESNSSYQTTNIYERD